MQNFGRGSSRKTAIETGWTHVSYRQSVKVGKWMGLARDHVH